MEDFIFCAVYGSFIVHLGELLRSSEVNQFT